MMSHIHLIVANLTPGTHQRKEEAKSRLWEEQVIGGAGYGWVRLWEEQVMGGVGMMGGGSKISVFCVNGTVQRGWIVFSLPNCSSSHTVSAQTLSIWQTGYLLLEM